MLKSFVKLAQEGADHDDRTLAHLLSNPTNDGGQWQMLVNLIEKYGLIPLSQWPSPVLAENSSRLNTVLNNQLRTNCSILLRMVKEGKTAKELDDAVCTMMSSIFEVISTCLGSPPQVVDFEYYDKDKNYHKVGPITPLQFYQTMFKPLFDLEKQVVLTHDPRSTSPYYKTYTVAYLNNMGSCKPVTYLNLPIEQLKKYTKDSIEADKAVWFGCDVGKEFSSEDATLVTDQFNYKLVLGIDIRGADKATRLLYKDSEMTHAMVFTGINVEENGEVSKYRVENSWGENGGSKGKGYLMMNDAWFDEYVYLVVIDQSLLSEDIIECLKQEPVVLPAWDPMGALAIN
ncbi:BLMH [Bugula neritina]|uniref:BLMH n=1 Tax=Bugula neritina TaxID=10212 RepID=A0A7J7JV17_BUGNE|nr:BLMH [Bugula neritina]